MTKRALLLLLVLTAACSDDPATPDAESAGVAATARRPNVVLILSDDQDLPSMAYMPRTRAAIGHRGITFDNAFVTTSLCCPSRTSILRGQYAHNHGVWTNLEPQGGFARIRALGLESSTLATWLHDAGYRTGLFGKYLNGYLATEDYAYVPPGWDEWHIDSQWQVRWLAHNGVLERLETSRYETDLQKDVMQQFIASAVADRKPFFAMMTAHAPHAPARPAPRHAGMYALLPVPRPPSFNVPRPGAAQLTPAQIDSVDGLYRARLESLQALDEAVDAVVTQLGDLNQLNNTLIIYTSDNGVFNGQHALLNDKNLPYEEAIRVPMLIRGPGVRRGGTRSHIALNIDLAPTIADFAGVPLPAWVDGRSLRPVLTETLPASAWRSGFVVENWFVPGAGAVAGVHDRNVLYVDWGGPEFYDLRTDPFQLNPGAGSQRQRDRYADWLARLRSCAGASCRTAEDTPPL